MALAVVTVASSETLDAIEEWNLWARDGLRYRWASVRDGFSLWRTLEPNVHVICTPTMGHEIGVIEVELDTDGPAAGFIRERRRDGSRWQRSLLEGGWEPFERPQEPREAAPTSQVY